MKYDVSPLIDAIDRCIAKEDEDLEATLTAEGFAAAKKAVDAISKLEDSITDALSEDADKFLDGILEVENVREFLENVWPDIKDTEELTETLRKIFREQFDDLLRSFTYEWMLAENPVLAGVDDRITNPAEDFIYGWSGELARLMNLSTKDHMERILLKAQKESMTIEEVSDAIADSGIRQCGYRSRRVAITEVLRVESYSQLEGMIQNPLCYKKCWVHTNEAKVPRENHIAIDGQEVFKREAFTLVGADGITYYPQCPRDTSLPAAESIHCHCRMETIKDDNALGMTDEELKELRKKTMDEIDAEYEAWENKFKEDYGIEEPRDDPSVTWEMYNAYYEAYRKGEI